MRLSKGGQLLTFVILAFLATQAEAAKSISLQPHVVGVGNDTDFDGHWDQSDPGCCLAYNGLPSTYNYRSAIEFDLQSLPSTSIVQSATLIIEYNGASVGPENTLQFNGYVGNGAIDLSDYEQINQIGPLLNSFGPGDGTLFYKIAYGPFVQSILDVGDRFVGVMIQNTILNQTYLTNPRLAITYVPEPTTLALAGLALAATLFRRRRLH